MSVLLSGWRNYIRVEPDSSKFRGSHTGVSVLIHISANSGVTGADLSRVFTELGNNRKKIAVATGDGRQCYVEIEKWDALNKQACLWAKVPNFATDTILFLYWDSTKPDNPYVADTGSAGNAWASFWTGIFHFAGGYNGTPGEVKDSTLNANHGRAFGSGGYPLPMPGVIGNGVYFDGNSGFD